MTLIFSHTFLLIKKPWSKFMHPENSMLPSFSQIQRFCIPELVGNFTIANIFLRKFKALPLYNLRSTDFI